MYPYILEFNIIGVSNTSTCISYLNQVGSIQKAPELSSQSAELGIGLCNVSRHRKPWENLLSSPIVLLMPENFVQIK